jgi:dihydrofolate synthase/folylpolyglutamate synthase
LDHEKFLGSTIKDIAGEKAGIVKAAVPVVCGDMPTEALEVIRERAGEVNAPFYIASEVMKPGKAAIQKVNYQSFECGNSTVELTMNGVMQQRNATLAAAVLEILGLWNDQSRNALKNTRWPARIEVLANGKIILDGGHNPDGLQALVETLKVLYPGKKYRWIFGAFADKDYSSGLKIIAPLAEELFAVGFAEEARLSASREDVCKTAAACMIGKTSPVEDLAGLLDEIKNGNAELPVIIAGSLYLAGEVLDLLGEKERVINLH